MNRNTLFFKLISAKALLMLMVSIMITSCMKDDLTDCPPPFNVQLTIKTDADANGLPSSSTFDRYNIDSVLVYVFDAQGQYVTSWSGGAYTKGQDYVVPLLLEPSEYQFAAITNQGGIMNMNYANDQLEIMRPSLDRLQTLLSLPESGEITTDIPDLHLGMLNAVTVSEERTDNNFTLVVTPQTYQVNFTIKGLPEDHQYSIEVSDKNFLRTLKNELLPQNDDLCYKRIVEAASPTVERKVSISMYNLMATKSMPIRIFDQDTGEQVRADVNLDLIDLIKRAYEKAGYTANFDTKSEFNVVVSFIGDIGITVTIDGWSLSGAEVDMG